MPLLYNMSDKAIIAVGWGGMIAGITIKQLNEMISTVVLLATLIVTAPKAFAVCLKYGHKFRVYLTKTYNKRKPS